MNNYPFGNYQMGPQAPNMMAQYPPYQHQFGPMDRLQQLQYDAQIRDSQAQFNQAQAFQNTSQGSKIINIGSIEEAKGYLSPNDGSRIFFFNSSNNEIYSKQLDFATGKSVFNTYKVDRKIDDKEIPVKTEIKDEFDFSKYVKKTEYDTLKRDFEALKKDFKEMFGDIKEEE